MLDSEGVSLTNARHITTVKANNPCVFGAFLDLGKIHKICSDHGSLHRRTSSIGPRQYGVILETCPTARRVEDTSVVAYYQKAFLLWTIVLRHSLDLQE